MKSCLMLEFAQGIGIIVKEIFWKIEKCDSILAFEPC